MNNKHRSDYLDLKDLVPDDEAVRWLPLDVARRCRALPIAQDDGVITIAMADPADGAARDAVVAALTEQAASRSARSPQVYLVRGDGALIDARLADLAGGEGAPQQVWLREPLHGDRMGVISYATQVAALLGAPLNRYDPLLPAQERPDSDAPGPRWESGAAAADDRLVILSCADLTLPDPLQVAGHGSGAALLYACRPRWPLRRLLLIVRGDPVDDAALAWAARLARATGSATTALMIAPHTAAGQASPSPQRRLPFGAHDDISSLLSANNALGHKMRHAAQRLDALQMDAVLHLRQGAPEVMIHEELASLPYDLIIAGVAVRGAEAQWRLRPLLHKMLSDLYCPLLLTGG